MASYYLAGCQLATLCGAAGTTPALPQGYGTGLCGSRWVGRTYATRFLGCTAPLPHMRQHMERIEWYSDSKAPCMGDAGLLHIHAILRGGD